MTDVSPTGGLVGPLGRKRLSVAVIANGTEAALRRTLADGQALADELLVVHAAGDDVAAVLTAFGARGLTAAVDDVPAARAAAQAGASGSWVLLLEAGETILAGVEVLHQVTRIAPQGPDIALVELHDPLAGEMGPYLAPRLIARGWSIVWAGPLRESVHRPAGGAVMVLPVSVGGVQGAVRPELRAASQQLGVALLRESLAEVPANPQAHHLLAGLAQKMGSWREASRHYNAAVAYSTRAGRWPAYVTESIDAQAEIAMRLGHLSVVERCLTEHSSFSVERPEFWLLRARADRLQGRHEAAAGAIAKGWELVQGNADRPWLRQRLALYAADLCIREGHWAAGVNWLIEAVTTADSLPLDAGPWCRWLADYMDAGDVERLAFAGGVDNWRQAVPAAPLLPEPQEPAVSVAVVVAVTPERPLADRCLPMVSLLADELFVVAPVGHPALDQAAVFAGKAVAAEGAMDAAVFVAMQTVTCERVLLLHGDEWMDEHSIRLLYERLDREMAPDGLAFDVHPAVETAGADVGAEGVVRLAAPGAITGVDLTAGEWLVAGISARSAPGVLIWRESVHPRDGRLPAALLTAERLLTEGEIGGAKARLLAWLSEQETDWPSPATWRAWEMLADIGRLLGDAAMADAAAGTTALYRPCLLRPGSRRAPSLPPDMAAGEIAVPDAVIAVVQRIVDGQVREALRRVDAATETMPLQAAVWGLAARVYLEGSAPFGAEAVLRRCLLLRARQPEPPGWFPDLGTVPDGLLGRLFLAFGQNQRALDWLLPCLAAHPGDEELALMTLAAAWRCGRIDVVSMVIGLLPRVVPMADRDDCDRNLADAAKVFGWPASSLAEWEDWLANPVNSMTS